MSIVNSSLPCVGDVVAFALQEALAAAAAATHSLTK